MKKLLSLILAVVLVVSVGSSAVNGTLAHFSDTEVSTDNEMCAGTLLLRVIGGPIEAELQPCQWHEAEMEVVNCGTREGIAYLKLENIEGIEDALGTEVTAEPEYVAEYGGQLGQEVLPGLGEDICNLYDHVYIEIWCDKDDDGKFERASGCDDELIYAGKLGEVIPCEKWKLGKLYAAKLINGGWGTYFEYHTGDGTDTAPVIAALIANRTKKVGWVSVWNDTVNLYVDYDTRDTTCWKICETHVHAGTDRPPQRGWGRFTYGADHPYIVIDDPCHVRYAIPLGELGATEVCTWLNIAAHAQGGPGCEDTGWAMRGPPRKLLVKLHVQDVPEACFGYDLFDETDPNVQEKCWDHWPTNAYMGDICQFDMKFTMNQDYYYHRWKWRSGPGWTYNWYYR